MSTKPKPSSTDKARQAEHRQKILAVANSGSKTGSGSRTYLRDKSDFLLSLAFDNHLPVVPSGGFFKKMGLSHEIEDFANYSLSSLEKNYIWQRHAPVDLNVSVDLVDQQAICEPQKALHSVAREAEMYLEGGANKGRGNNKLHHISAHWWLRETKCVHASVADAVHLVCIAHPEHLSGLLDTNPHPRLLGTRRTAWLAISP